jgi:aspartate kinase
MTISINVAKFGGTSVANFDAIQNCIKVIGLNQHTRVVVVSAASGVTNLLVELAHQAHTQEQIQALCQKITDKEYAILSCLKHPENVEAKLEALLDELESLAFHEEITHSDGLKDQLLSLGERMSSLFVSACLAETGVNALNFDIRNVLSTDSNFGEAKPNIDKIRNNALRLLLPQLGDAIIVTQGFIGSDDQGATTTLGRGGSDFTAALLAEAIDADSCEIWTDVNGVYTTDPRITDQAQPIDELSFEEAAEMATFGAKVLHPATMEPALRKNIRVFVGSSKEPELGGTWLVKDCQHEPPFRAITRRKEQVMVTVKTPKMLYAQGFLEKVFAVIAKHNLSVDLVTTSEISVSFTLDNPPNSVAEKLNKKTLADLEEMCEVMVERDLDLVTIVGNQMQSVKGVTGKVFAALDFVEVRMICFGANPHNMSFLVKSTESDRVVKVLHDALFTSEQGS